MNGPIYHAIERDGRRFNFLTGWEEASVSQIATVFEPVIDIVLSDSPPPAGDYYFAGCSAETSYFQVPIHDVPGGARCECGSTAVKEEASWFGFWSTLGTSPKDNVIYYNLKAVTFRLAETKREGWPESHGPWLIASFLIHELHHVRYHQKMLHAWEGESEAWDVQQNFMKRTAPLFGIQPAFLKRWLKWCDETKEKQEADWRRNHPSWRGK